VRLDGSSPAVRVEQALSRTGELGPVKTPKSRRPVLLSPQTAALFAELIDGKQQDALVFSAPKGGPWNAGNMRYGWDFCMIQLRLGHASIKTTFDTYGHLLAHGERDRLQTLDERLPRSRDLAARSPSPRRSRRRFS
jgi:integrase